MHNVANSEYLEKFSNLFVVKNNNYNLRNNGIDYTLEKPRTNLILKKALVIVVQKCGMSYQWN